MRRWFPLPKMKKYNIVLRSVKTSADDEKIKACRGGSDNKLLKKFKRYDSVLLIPRALLILFLSPFSQFSITVSGQKMELESFWSD